MAIVLDGTTGITTPGLTNTGTETLVNLTTTGNTILGDASTDTLNVGNGGLIKDASGNVGVGVTPSAWGLGKAIEIGWSGNGLWGVQSSGDMRITANTYYDGTNYKLVSGGSYASYYRQSNGIHSWLTSTGTTAGNATFTQAMTLDASGNLGLGVTTVLGRAQFNVSDTSTTILNNPALYLSNTGTATTNQRVDLGFRWQDGTYNGSSAISAIRESGTNRLTALAFCPADSSGNAVERARIDSSGNLLVGTTSTSVTSGGLTSQFANGESYFNIGHKSGTSSGAYFGAFSYNGSVIGGITQNGTTAVAYNTSSDYRLKNTIAPMTGALAKVAMLKPVTYKWNADGSDGEGFIAHELAEVCPHAVTGEKDAIDSDGNPQYQGIDTSFLVATLTAAIQEQQALIQTLTDRITALEAK